MGLRHAKKGSIIAEALEIIDRQQSCGRPVLSPGSWLVNGLRKANMYCVLPENPKEIPQKLEWSGFSAAETYGTCTGPRSGEEPRNDPLQPPPRLLQNQYTQPTGDNLIFGHPFQREGSLTGPLFACHAYPPQHPWRPVSTAGGPFGYYLLPVPVTLPLLWLIVVRH
jgi:hypothetical protein